MANFEQLKAEFDLLKAAVDTERAQITAKLDELQATIDSLTTNIAEGGTDEERSSLLASMSILRGQIADIIPDAPAPEPQP